MPTNGIHLVLGISGICPFLPAPSATLLSPTVLVAVSYRRLSFSHFVFSSYSICMYFVLVHNSNKKRRILCTLYILVCACVFARLRIRNVGLIYQKQHFVLRCVLCLFWQIMQMACKRCLLSSRSSSYTDAFFGFASPIMLLPIVLPASLSAAHSLSAFSWLNLRCVSSLSSSSFRHKQLHTIKVVDIRFFLGHSTQTNTSLVVVFVYNLI